MKTKPEKLAFDIPHILGFYRCFQNLCYTCPLIISLGRSNRRR